MSKRFTAEEWSDDDIEGNGLSASPQKKQKNSEESSGRGLLSRISHTITSSVTSSVQKIFKNFSLSPEERQMSCESVRSQSSLGMNQTNDSFTQNVRSDEPMVRIDNCQNQFILTQFNHNSNPNYVLIQSPQQSAQYISPNLMPVQFISSNASPNNSVVLVMDPIRVNKCGHCGQVSTSPISQCRHCNVSHQRTSLPHQRASISVRNNLSPISTQSFYKTQSNLGISRRNDIQSHSMMNTAIARPLISGVRSLSNSQHLSRINVNSIPKQLNPEVIELDGETAQQSVPQRLSHESSDDGIEVMDSTDTETIPNSGPKDKCNTRSDVNSNVCSKYFKHKSDEQNQNNSSNEVTVIEDSFRFPVNTLPEYAMFGTFKTTPKVVEFTADGIKLTNVSPNSKETKFKYHIMVPFSEIQELLFCSNDSINLFFIKPTVESNLKIQESMFLGTQSTNGLKFDVKSEDSRQHYIIIELKDKIGDKFIKALDKHSKQNNPNIKFDDIDVDFGKHLLNRAKTRESSPEIKIQTISSANKTNSIMKTPPNRYNPFAAKSNSNRNNSSDSSDASPSPQKPYRRPPIKTPVPTITTVTLDDDEDDEEIIENMDQKETEFEKVIFSYPEDDKNAIHLFGTDIKCLNKGEFLNDNIVNFYLRYFFNEILEEEMRQRTHIFDCLFVMELMNRKRKNGSSSQESFVKRYEQKLKKWTKNVEIFSKDFLIFPIIQESHWFLSIVCYPKAAYYSQLKYDSKLPKIESEERDVIEVDSNSEKQACVIFMDSLGNGGLKKSLSTPIKEFLSLEWKSKYDFEVNFKLAKTMRDFAPHVPIQNNSSDCGLFVLEYVEQFLKKTEDTSPDILVSKLFGTRKYGLLDWFEAESVKPKRQAIRALILNKVSPELKERLETLIDDSKLSDNEDFDEIGLEAMNTSTTESMDSKSPEQEVL